MNKTEYLERLNKLKNFDIDMQNLIFLVGNKNVEMCQHIVAWKNTKVVIDFNRKCEKISDEWDDLWQYSMFDEKQFAELCELSVLDARKKLEKIKTLRLIYPDGTTNNVVDGIINGILKKNISSLTGIKEKNKND